MTIFKDFETPPTELLTLSAMLKNQGYTLDKDGLESHLNKIESWDSFLDSNIQIGHFVPCIDGKPISEPLTIGGGIAEQAEADARVAYQKAEAAVLFEGWEMHEGYAEYNNWRIRFSTNRIFLDENVGDIQFVGHVLNSPTYSDLAAATINNPLKFKQ